MSITKDFVTPRNNRIKMGKDEIVLNVIGYLVIGLLAIVCCVPFLMLLSGSVQSEQTVLREGYSLIPREIKLDAYKYLLANPSKIIRAYGVSISITVVGTTLGVLLSAMTAYVLSRNCLKYKGIMSFYLFFTTLFGGGLVSSYLVTINVYHLRNTWTILLVSGLMGFMNIIMIRTYIQNSIPESLIEAAKVDGASEFKTCFSIVFPLLKPVVASVALFSALGYWNNWGTAMLYISNEKLVPLQYMLYKIIAYARAAQQIMENGGLIVGETVPQETVKLAMTVLATGPIILAYPFAQRYLVDGMTIGAVKG